MPRIVGFKSNTKQCADFHALGQQENFKHMFTICENQVRAAGALTSGDKQMWDNIRALAEGGAAPAPAQAAPAPAATGFQAREIDTDEPTFEESIAQRRQPVTQGRQMTMEDFGVAPPTNDLTPAQMAVEEMREGLPRNFPSMEALDMVPSEDTPKAVAAELRRSQFLRGSKLASFQQLDPGLLHAKFTVPPRYQTKQVAEIRFGLTKGRGDVPMRVVSRVIAWMRVNAISFAIGLERGTVERNLHLQGSFSMYIDTSKQYWSRPLVSHLRGFAGLVRNTGYAVFCRRFEYRSGYNLESYLGYSIKDFGTTWFRHYSSPDFTLKRLEHAAMLRRLMDSGRSDQIAIKREKIVASVEVFYRMHFRWCVPKPRFDVLLCWMIQSGRYYFHQNVFWDKQATPYAPIATATWAEEPWRCTLPNLWKVVFAIRSKPFGFQKQQDPLTIDEIILGEGTDVDDVQTPQRPGDLAGLSPYDWHDLAKFPVPRRYCRPYDEMVLLEPAMCSKTLDEISDDEAEVGMHRQLLPSLQAAPRGPIRRRNVAMTIGELLHDRDRVDAETPTDGRCFWVAAGLQIAAINGVIDTVPNWKEDHASVLLFSQLGLLLTMHALRAFAESIAKAVVGTGVDVVALLEEVSEDFIVDGVQYGREHCTTDVEYVMAYISKRADLLEGLLATTGNIMPGELKHDSPWGPGIAFVDLYALALLQRSKVFFHKDNDRQIHIFEPSGVDVALSEKPLMSKLDVPSDALVFIGTFGGQGARGLGHFRAGVNLGDPCGPFARDDDDLVESNIASDFDRLRELYMGRRGVVEGMEIIHPDHGQGMMLSMDVPRMVKSFWGGAPIWSDSLFVAVRYAECEVVHYGSFIAALHAQQQEQAAAEEAAAAGAPTYFAVGTRVKCKDGTVGSISKVCHDDPDGVYYQVDCPGGRVIDTTPENLEPATDEAGPPSPTGAPAPATTGAVDASEMVDGLFSDNDDAEDLELPPEPAPAPAPTTPQRRPAPVRAVTLERAKRARRSIADSDDD